MMQLKKYNRMPATLGDIFAEAWPDYYFRRGTAPQVNVIESDRKFKIEIAAPGMSKDDLKIELTADGQLMVSLEKSEEHDDKEPKNCDKEGKSCDKEECCHYLRREFSCSAFRQFFTIPESVDKERVTAKMRHGILCIKLPKRDGADKASAARQIAIE